MPWLLFRFPERHQFLVVRLNLWAWPLMTSVGRLYRATLGRRQRVVAVIGSLGKTTATRATMGVLYGRVPRWAHVVDNCAAFVPFNLLRRGPLRHAVVVEVGVSRPTQMIRYACTLVPDVVVVTSIGTEHLENYASLERLREEKAVMVRALRPTGVAVLNGDDVSVMWMATQTVARIVTFGFDPGCTVSASDVTLEWPHGTRFIVHANGASAEVRSRLVGRTMIAALLAAAATGLAEGLDLNEIVHRLEGVPPTPGRLQAMSLPSGATLLSDDFKATVESVHAALDVLAQIPARRRIVVLGDLDRPPRPQRPHYRAVGEHAANVADLVVAVGRRFEHYRRGLRQGRLSNDAIVHVRTVHEAIAALEGQCQAGDVILVKGSVRQRLARVSLALLGNDVRCRVEQCPLTQAYCSDCPMLRRDWNYDPAAMGH